MARDIHTTTGTDSANEGPLLYTLPRYRFEGDNYPVIALLHGDGPSVVWHIDTDPNAKTRQRIGAWVFGVGNQVPSTDAADPTSWAGARLSDAALPSLLLGRAIVATESGLSALESATLDEVSEAFIPSFTVDLEKTTAELQKFIDHLRAVDAASRSTNPVMLTDIPQWSPETIIAEAQAQAAVEGGADDASADEVQQTAPSAHNPQEGDDLVDAAGADNSGYTSGSINVAAASDSADPLDTPAVRTLISEGLALSTKIVDIIAIWNENESRRRLRKVLRADELGGEKAQVIPLILSQIDEY